MKGFLLENGDVKIRDGKICMTKGDDLLRQTVESVLGTNKGEWFLNEKEGIDFKKILIKNPNFDVIRDEIQEGLNQVDSTLVLMEYSSVLEDRTLRVKFKARNSSGLEVEGGKSYAR